MKFAQPRIDISYEHERAALRAVAAAFSPRRRKARGAGRKRAAARTGNTKAAQYLAALSDAYGPLPSDALQAELPPFTSLLLDASALAALARGEARARAYLMRAVGCAARVLVPASALLETRLGAVADAVGEIVPLDETVGREAAALLDETGCSAPLAALIVACAARRRPAAIMTAEPSLIGELARATSQAELFVLAVATSDARSLPIAHTSAISRKFATSELPP